MVQTDAEWGSGMGPASNCTSQPCGPSGRLVMTFGYVITDLRIYPPPSPSRLAVVRRVSANQNVAGSLKAK